MVLFAFNNACTLWFDRVLWWDWHACCVAHDHDYGAGMVKQIADYFLGACVNHVLPGMGSVMWLGVAIFGAFFYHRAARRRAGRVEK